MFWIIFLYVLAGLAILHLYRVKKLDTKNPNLSLSKVLYEYWCAERFFILISIIALFVVTALINVGLGAFLAQLIFGASSLIDTGTPWGIRAISFILGVTMQGFLTWISQRKYKSAERILQKESETGTNS